MTCPLFAGSFLNAASWASPTVSNVTPTAQTTTPTQTSGQKSSGSTIAICTGRDTNHITRPCGTCTLRTIPHGPASSSRST